MPRICYQPKKFSADSQGLIDKANTIIAEYTKQGYQLTLRQLYYQFVSRDIIPNNMKSYKRLGSVINDARLAGLIDWKSIEDRVRNLEVVNSWDTTRGIIEDCEHWFHYDLWESQKHRIEVWVEKDALVGVVERACKKFRVPYIACRGYMSQSEAWAAGQRFNGYDQKVIVLHLGDHDPSGIDMTRDNDDRLQMFTTDGDVTVIRIALNSDQVQQYNPPPNPAKLTDSRAEGYIAKFGDESWELDALEPSVIENLITTHVRKYIDVNKWNEAVERENFAKAHIRTQAEDWVEPDEA